MLADLGLLALRLALGAVFLAHGAQKGFGAFGGPGFEGATGFIGSLGFRPARLWAGLAVGGVLVPARGAHTRGELACARDDGGGDRQGARTEGLLHSERRVRVQPGP